MSMTVTIVVAVNDGKLVKSKHITATAGQEASLHAAGEAAVAAVRTALGAEFGAKDVTLTSVVVA